MPPKQLPIRMVFDSEKLAAPGYPIKMLLLPLCKKLPEESPSAILPAGSADEGTRLSFS